VFRVLLSETSRKSGIISDFFFIFRVQVASGPDICMKINEFIGLTFFEANKVIKKALGNNRIPSWSFDIKAFKTALGLSDAIWGEITQDGDVNSKVEIRDKWAVTKLRVILSFRYSKDIQINYYIGNTNDSCTLKEITYSGIGTY
jgi:hypothetical protein